MSASRRDDGGRASAADVSSAGAGVVPREGSSLYYSLLWTDAARRSRFLARLALVRALATTLDEVHDPGVAERKVHWWHEEIERLAAGTPRHPCTVACTDSLGGLAQASAPCLDILSIAATVRYTPPATDEEQGARLRRDHGARLALLAHALSDTASDLDDAAIRHPGLALGLGLHATLARLPALLHRGFAVFADERYARHGLTPAMLARHVRRATDDDGPNGSSGGESASRGTSGDTPGDSPGGTTSGTPGSAPGGVPIVVASPDRRAIVAECVAEAAAALEAALNDASYRRTYARAELAPLARLAALRARQLRLWRDARPDLLRETMTATPLTKLFVAWRHRRGAR